MWRRLASVVVAAALAGCGGPIQADELGRGVDSLGALAAEGALIADGVARDRTKATFTRVQARTLAGEADHEAEKLGDATAPPELARAKAQAVRLAQDVAGALGDLQVAPDDAAGARAAKRALSRLSDEARRLAERL